MKSSTTGIEQLGAQGAEVHHNSNGLLRRYFGLAHAALRPSAAVAELDTLSFAEVEDSLAELTHEADNEIEKRGKPTRKLRKELVRHAWRLIAITEEKPEVLDNRAVSLLAQTADATNKRALLQETLDHAIEAGMRPDTNVQLQAIKAALELDASFGDVMRTLNKAMPTAPVEEDTNHTPLPAAYNYLFDDTIRPPKTHKIPVVDRRNGRPINTGRPLYARQEKDESTEAYHPGTLLTEYREDEN